MTGYVAFSASSNGEIDKMAFLTTRSALKLAEAKGRRGHGMNIGRIIGESIKEGLSVISLKKCAAEKTQIGSLIMWRDMCKAGGGNW